MPAKKAEIIMDLYFRVTVSFPKTLNPTSSSLVASKSLPNGDLVILQMTKTVITVIMATKMRKETLLRITKPKKSGLEIPGMPRLPNLL